MKFSTFLKPFLIIYSLFIRIVAVIRSGKVIGDNVNIGANAVGNDDISSLLN